MLLHRGVLGEQDFHEPRVAFGSGAVESGGAAGGAFVDFGAVVEKGLDDLEVLVFGREVEDWFAAAALGGADAGAAGEEGFG